MRLVSPLVIAAAELILLHVRQDDTASVQSFASEIRAAIETLARARGLEFAA
jgi:hypothetical protein